MTPEEYDKYIRSEVVKLGKVVQGIRREGRMMGRLRTMHWRRPR